MDKRIEYIDKYKTLKDLNGGQKPLKYDFVTCAS